MMDLLQVIFSSDKRRNLLLLLNKGPNEWDEIKRILGFSSTGMLPQVKILEEECLIKREGKVFSLTPIGRALANHMEPLISTVEVFEKEKKFWQEHAIEEISDEILMYIRELGNYQILKTAEEEIFDANIFLNNIANSRIVKGISHAIHPKYPEFFLNLAKKGAESSLILTPGVFEIVKNRYHDLMEEWLQCDGSTLYVSNDDIKFSYIVTDSYFSISLFLNSGVFDSINDVVSWDPSALRLGERIFSYYSARSEKIDSLD